MRRVLLFVVGAVFGSGISQLPKLAMHGHAIPRGAQKDATTNRDVPGDTEERFAFVAHAPLEEEVTSLMGAVKERLWARLEPGVPPPNARSG